MLQYSNLLQDIWCCCRLYMLRVPHLHGEENYVAIFFFFAKHGAISISTQYLDSRYIPRVARGFLCMETGCGYLRCVITFVGFCLCIKKGLHRICLVIGI